MSWLPIQLVRNAQISPLLDGVPHHLRASYLEIACLPNDRTCEHMRATRAFLAEQNRSAIANSRCSSMSTSRSSSKRSTQASTNTSYSQNSIDSLIGSEINSPDAASAGAYPEVSKRQAYHPGSATRTSRKNSTLLDTIQDAVHSETGNTPRQGNAAAEKQRCHCPWCGQSCSRPQELKTHMNTYCGSKKFRTCITCRFVARSKEQRTKHEEQHLDVGCTAPDFLGGDMTLHHDRQAYACGLCPALFKKLDCYITHVYKQCIPRTRMGPPERTRQIRTLLQQPLLKERVEQLCHPFGHSPSAIDNFEWRLSEHELDRIVEALEYSHRDAYEGLVNCGIPSAEIDWYLCDLLEKVIVHSKPGRCEHTPSICSPNLLTTGTPTQAGSKAVIGRLNQMKQPSPGVMQPVISNKPQCESPKPFDTDSNCPGTLQGTTGDFNNNIHFATGPGFTNLVNSRSRPHHQGFQGMAGPSTAFDPTLQYSEPLDSMGMDVTMNPSFSNPGKQPATFTGQATAHSNNWPQTFPHNRATRLTGSTSTPQYNEMFDPYMQFTTWPPNEIADPADDRFSSFNP